jgi:hypothetical protein
LAWSPSARFSRLDVIKDALLLGITRLSSSRETLGSRGSLERRHLKRLRSPFLALLRKRRMIWTPSLGQRRELVVVGGVPSTFGHPKLELSTLVSNIWTDKSRSNNYKQSNVDSWKIFVCHRPKHSQRGDSRRKAAKDTVLAGNSCPVPDVKQYIYIKKRSDAEIAAFNFRVKKLSVAGVDDDILHEIHLWRGEALDAAIPRCVRFILAPNRSNSVNKNRSSLIRCHGHTKASPLLIYSNF